MATSLHPPRLPAATSNHKIQVTAINSIAPVFAGSFLLIFAETGVMSFRIGNGIDFHRLTEGRELWLGGVKIPHVKGALGHSDADVLLHAICDALLGALALGDIGQHFPDTSAEFKDIDSKILLSRTIALVTGRDFRVVNIDSTICAERPKLRPYMDAMRETIAHICNIDTASVSIKATTTEQLGAIGREEGIAAFATVLLEKI